jgi:hypothetical protein
VKRAGNDDRLATQVVFGIQAPAFFQADFNALAWRHSIIRREYAANSSERISYSVFS